MQIIGGANGVTTEIEHEALLEKTLNIMVTKVLHQELQVINYCQRRKEQRCRDNQINDEYQ